MPKDLEGCKREERCLVGQDMEKREHEAKAGVKVFALMKTNFIS